MRKQPSTARLLAATAICTLSPAPAWAGNYGAVLTDPSPSFFGNDVTLEGDLTGVLSTGGRVTLLNFGSIIGHGTNGSTTAPNGGLVISGYGADVTNEVSIVGDRFGITTAYYFNPATGLFEGRAIGTTVANDGIIEGLSDDGIRLIGGGSVTNGGYIAGRVGAGADGISIFAYNGQDLTGVSSIGTVTNLAGGVIEGNRYGVIIFGPGEIDNAGTITGTTSVQGSFLFPAGQAQAGTVNNSGTINGYGIVMGTLDTANVDNSGRTGTIGFAGIGTGSVNNSGTVTYFTSFSTVGTANVNNSGSIGEGLIFNKTTTANVTNSGSITATNTPDVVGTTQDAVYSDAALTLTNTATGSINGFVSGIRSDGTSATIDNAGTIRGNGTSGNFSSPNGGIVLSGGPGSITNSGTISGAAFGITTSYYKDPVSGQVIDSRAIGSTVTNTGSIIGDTNDGIRLIGGGTVINSGYIAGRVGAGADGVSMFAFDDQPLNSYSSIGSVTNLLGGTIEGNRLGIILSAGGSVSNAGTINGGTNGAIVIQAIDSGRTGTIGNTGTINGWIGFNDLASATITNTGSISTATGAAIQGNAASLTIDNQAGGTIAGASSGIFQQGAALSVGNAGTIRGNGTAVTGRIADAGILITGGPATINNSGSISGAGFGITTGIFSDPNTNAPSGRAIGSTVTNSGSIIGDNNDGIRLMGGGSVTNSGYIAGRIGAGADGISMFSFFDQDLNSFSTIGTVTNLATGVIEGNRFGIIMSNGGSVNNAGTITGISGSVLLQAGAVGVEPPRNGTVTNSGTLNGTVQFNNLANASVTNSGTIASPGGAGVFTTAPSGSLSVDNRATGSIMGATSGIDHRGPSLTVNNAGVIRGNGTVSSLTVPNAGIVFSAGPGNITNSGSISGATFGIASALYTDPATSQVSGLAIGSVISNTGSIIGDNGHGIRLVGGGSVTNSGYIAGRSAAGATADGISMFPSVDQAAANSIGGVTNLAGGTIEGNRAGVLLSGGGSITNGGTIQGNVAGVAIQSGNFAGRIGTLANSGTITGGALFIGLDSATVSNSGTLNGALNYSGVGSATLANSGSISAGSGDAVGADGPLSINNSAAGSIVGAADGVNATGSSLTLVNAGLIRGTAGTGVNLNAGSITNAAGGLINGGTIGIYFVNGAGSVSNAGTISVTSGDAAIAFNSMGTAAPSTVTNSGTISGEVQFGSNQNASLTNRGSITALGSGLAVWSITPTTIVNSGSISTTGSTAVQLGGSNDTVTLNTGSSITGIVDGGGGVDTLRLSGTSATPTSQQTIGQFANFENLNVLGGYWSGAGSIGTFTSTTISGGALAVNGTLVSPVTVNAGGMLAGIGTITGATTLNSGGILAPGGSSIGTLNITGNVAFNSGSTFSVQTNASGASDKLAVTGAVNIATGAGIQILAGIAVYPAAGTSFTVLTATGGITGKFDKAVTDYNYYNVSVNVQKKGTVTVNLTPNGKPLPSAATATTFSAATAVDSLGSTSPLYLAVFNQSLAGARQAFSALSGGAYNRLDALLAGGPGRMELAAGDGDDDGIGLDWSGIQSLSSHSLNSGSFMRRGRLSLMLIGGRYVTRIASDSIDADVDTRFVATGVAYRSGRFQGLASIGGAWHDVAVGRTIAFPGFASRTQSHYAAQSTRIDLESSYALSRGTVGIAPYAGYSRIMSHSPAFAETGSFASVTFQSNNSTADQLRAGLRAEGKFSVAGIRVAPHLDASVQRSWSDSIAGRGAYFIVGGNRFESIGAGFDERMANIDAGADIQAGPVTLTATYRAQLGNRWYEQSGLVRAALRF